MSLMLVLALSFGAICGIFTGLLPGLHVNLVSAILLSISPLLLKYVSPLDLGAFIISLATVHSFLDTIPSIYLGAPENENALSVLPGQKMLLEGRGHEAVVVTIIGTYGGLILAIFLIPAFMIIAEPAYRVVKPYTAIILIAFMTWMILNDKNRLWNALVFLFSGTLGLMVFSIPGLNEPLFPLLSGLFGISGLILGFGENTNIPKQNTQNRFEMRLVDVGKAVGSSAVGVLAIQLFPGLGPAQGAVISSQVVKVSDSKTYLSLVGAMGTMSVVFSLVTFVSLGKAKDGAIVVLSKLIEVDIQVFYLLIVVMLIAGSIGVILTFAFSRLFARLMERLNYGLLILCVIACIIVMVMLINGPLGILILGTATAIGLIAPLVGSARSHAMGALILPVILYLLL